MILALSRFRVANSMEEQVRAAFIDRPGLVDSALGFLGMETFTDKSDPTIFYLVTRWSDQESFHAWHRSKEHHESHRFIPKGLKLDSSYTQVIELERIGSSVTRRQFEEITADAVPLLSRFINDSGDLHLLAASSDGTILTVNAAVVRRMLQSSDELEGSSLWERLTEADNEMLRAKVKRGERCPDETLLLNFVDHENAPYSILCKLDLRPDGFVIVGEPPLEKEEALQADLFELNNELAVLSRENVRKNRELQQALGSLKEAQAMIIQQEKMASLGQMTAGVAHEINNPISFVLSNHETMGKDFRDLMSMINLLGDSLDELSTTNTALYERIVSKAAEIDLSSLVESIPRKINHNLEGLERVKRIVLDLRSFSRLDDNALKPADVNEGITSTLRFLSPLIEEHGATIRTCLGNVALLNCAPGSLNQAFSNVIANAVQAGQPGNEVVISSSQENGSCIVKVEDHGEGITPEHLTKIFDPFFTTKPVGSGTGLGLHIARQIVTAHHGDMQVESERNVGTTVRIRIPYAKDAGGERATAKVADTGEPS